MLLVLFYGLRDAGPKFYIMYIESACAFTPESVIAVDAAGFCSSTAIVFVIAIPTALIVGELSFRISHWTWITRNGYVSV
jgi:hypothetical protein